MTHLILNSGSRILISHWYPADTVWRLVSAFCSLSLFLSLSLCGGREGEEGERESLAMCHTTPVIVLICLFQ